MKLWTTHNHKIPAHYFLSGYHPGTSLMCNGITIFNQLTTWLCWSPWHQKQAHEAVGLLTVHLSSLVKHFRACFWWTEQCDGVLEARIRSLTVDVLKRYWLENFISVSLCTESASDDYRQNIFLSTLWPCKTIGRTKCEIPPHGQIPVRIILEKLSANILQSTHSTLLFISKMQCSYKEATISKGMFVFFGLYR